MKLPVILLLALAATAAAAPKPVYESPALTSTSKPRLVEVDVALKGAKELYLVVSDEGADSCDWSDWVEPKLVMSDGSVRDLTTLKWKSAKSAHGSVNIGKNYSGGALTVEKKIFANGFGTHAASLIAYDLPEGVARFTGRVAIDDGGIERSGAPSDAKVKFLLYTEKPATTAGGEVLADAGPPLVPVEMFAVPEGLEVTVWATSPMLFNPTNIDFDAQGRLYVAEGVNYRGKAGRRPEGDRIVVLEDTKGAGRADKASVFVQETGLAAPLGIGAFENRIVSGAGGSPEISRGRQPPEPVEKKPRPGRAAEIPPPLPGRSAFCLPHPVADATG